MARSMRAPRRICNASIRRRSASRLLDPILRAIRLLDKRLQIFALRLWLVETKIKPDWKKARGKVPHFATLDLIKAQLQALIDLIERNAHTPQHARNVCLLALTFLQRGYARRVVHN